MFVRKFGCAALGTLFFALAASANAQVLQLITTEEASLPLAPHKPATRAITRGPGVKLSTPEQVGGKFPFKIAFEQRGESKIDLGSLKVEYLKGSIIDLTARVKGNAKPEGIEIPVALAPAGEHPIRVSVKDSEGRTGTAEFKLTVK